MPSRSPRSVPQPEPGCASERADFGPTRDDEKGTAVPTVLGVLGVAAAAGHRPSCSRLPLNDRIVMRVPMDQEGEGTVDPQPSPVDPYGRARGASLSVLVIGAFLFLRGFMGPHGEGGGGIVYLMLTTWLGLLSMLLGLITSIAGVSRAPGSPGRRLLWVHLAVCGAALALQFLVDPGHWT